MTYALYFLEKRIIGPNIAAAVFALLSLVYGCVMCMATPDQLETIEDVESGVLLRNSLGKSSSVVPDPNNQQAADSDPVKRQLKSLQNQTDSSAAAPQPAQ